MSKNVISLVLALASSLYPTRQAAQSQVDHANEAVIVEQSRVTIDVATDGSSSTRQEFRGRVQSSAGLQQLGTVVVPFSKMLGSGEIEYVRVRKPSGQVIETPVATAIDVPADVTRAAPTYSDVYLKHVNVQGLSVGDSVEFAAKVTQQSLLPGHFAVDFQFPVLPLTLSQELRLRIPARMQPTVRTRGTAPDVSDNNGTREYVWRRSSPKRLSDDELGTLIYGLTKQRPEIQVSTVPTWAELGSAVARLWKDRAAVTPAVRAKATELTKGLTTDEARARALYAFVATKIRYVSVQMGIGRLQPHPADQVLSNGFGDCKDKHILLASLLAAAGLEARAALIGVDMPFDAEVPTWNAFNHVITSLSVNGQRVWLDATLEVAPFNFLSSPERGKSVLVFGERGPVAVETTPKVPTRPDLANVKLDGTVTDAGRLEATVDARLTGDVELLYRSVLRGLGQAEWAEFLKGALVSLPEGAVVSEIESSALEDTTTPLTLKYRVAVSTLPNWSRQTVDSLVPAMVEPPGKDAKFPLPLGENRAETSVRLKLPEAMTAKLQDGTDADVEAVHPWGEFRRKTRLEGHVFTVEQAVDYRVEELAVDQFEAYRAHHSRVSSLGDAVVLTRRKAWGFSEGSTIDWFGGAPSATISTLREVLAQAQRGDKAEAAKRIEALHTLHPEEPSIAVVRAWLAADSGNQKQAINLLSAQITRAPSPSTYKLLARYLWSSGLRGESADALKSGHDRYPEDREFPLHLGESYAQLGRHADAVRVLEPRLASEGDSARLYWNLGKAYIGLTAGEKAIDALRKAVALDPSPYCLNNVAWALADARLGLEDAVTWSTKAVAETETAAGTITLGSLADAQLRQMRTLAMYWDTLAWALFRKGDLTRAEDYLLASWELTQAGVYADHLGDLYRQKGDTALAAAFYARGSVTSPSDPASPAKLRALVATAAEVASIEARERPKLMSGRQFTVPRVANATGTAEAFVLLAPTGKVEDVRFISGSDSLRPGIELLRTAAIPSRMPNGTVAKVVRRVVVTCTAGVTCDAILLTADMVTSVR